MSLYVPTTPVSNYREENRILYKDQVKKAIEALEGWEIDKSRRAELIEQLESVGTDETFWTHQQNGLVVFVSPNRFIIRTMMTRPESALAIVGHEFYLRPALREASHWMQYQVLCVSLHDVTLYNGNQEQLTEVELHRDVPRGMGEALGKTETSANRKDGERSGDDSTDLKQYFKAIDQAIRAHHTGKQKRPLVLAMVAEHQGLFREVSEHPHLLESGIDQEPFEAIRQHNLGEMSWEVARQATRTDLDALIEQYQERASHGEGESDLEKIAYSATIGQVGTLLIDTETRIEGTVDAGDGKVDYDQPGTEDVLDAIAKHVISTDGEVVFVPSELMPARSGVAAILRYAMEPV
ncbi:baeRF3 domain-containing protein [Halomonas borealis]|uniref:baeRF3 domain-containing protein n=1 Tax=Halomonas borealis TaxID=2508710 RepID=UPI001F117410|nr:hypothetical protein [Halomonas borealis]